MFESEICDLIGGCFGEGEVSDAVFIGRLVIFVLAVYGLSKFFESMRNREAEKRWKAIEKETGKTRKEIALMMIEEYIKAYKKQGKNHVKTKHKESLIEMATPYIIVAWVVGFIMYLVYLFSIK